MTRKALLIASPDAGVPKLGGTLLDVERFHSFLVSNAGGAWESYEITKLTNPSKASVTKELQAMATASYGFISFSGHGLHARSKLQSETRVCLNSSEDMAVSDLNPRNLRHLVIVDACRSIEDVELTEERANAIMAANASTYASRAEVRAAFDSAVSLADAGRVVAYACEIGHTAGEVSTVGGIFSTELVVSAQDWARRAAPRAILGLPEAFQTAADATYRRNAPQKPELESGRRLRHFPFAVGT